jgi:propanol-preferring alcohol dehydrogenase
LRLARIEDVQSLGLTGFVGAAHLVLQLARHLYPHTDVFVFTRDPEARSYAREPGAVWAGDTTEPAPTPLHAIIDTTPAGEPVVEAMANLRPAGRLVINAICTEEQDKGSLLRLSYHNDLWLEKEIKSVANVTHRDIGEFLPIAGRIPLRPSVQTYRLEEANRALLELKRGPVSGAKVLLID